MSKANIIKKVKQYAELVKTEFPVKMVILQKAYPGEEYKKNCEIEVAVVVDILDGDLLEAKDRLVEMAKQVDPRIDPVLIEEEKEDNTGFFEEIRKTGEIIY